MKNEDNIKYWEDIDFSEDMDDEELYLKNRYSNELEKIFSKKEQSDEFYKYTSDSDNWDEVQERFKIDQKITDTFIDNIKTDICFKKRYAKALLVLLIFQLVAVNVIFILRGRNILEFSDVTFNIFISGALIEVIALVTIVVKYLFKDNISDVLNSIFEKNRKR